MGPRRSRTLLFAATTFILSVVIVLVMAEGLLRVCGYRPWRAGSWATNREPTMNEPVAGLGWQSKPGAYRYPAYKEGLDDISITIWEDSSRATAAQPTRRDDRVFLMGGSFTFGAAISDDETFGWRLQEAMPAVEIRNYATVAYGTYQSLLKLERVLDEAGDARPGVVVYGFYINHEIRNVCTANWLLGLSRLSHRNLVHVPFCSMTTGGALVRRDPDRFPQWPAKRYLATVTFGEEMFARYQRSDRKAQARAVTEALMLEMNALCRVKGIALVVVLLEMDASSKASYAGVLERAEINVVDGTRADFLDESMKVPREGHPNGRMHAYWAECLEPEIRGRIEAVD